MNAPFLTLIKFETADEMLLKVGLIDRTWCVAVSDRYPTGIKWRRRAFRPIASPDRSTGKTKNVQLLIGYR